jgi:dimethylargininase
MAGKVFTRSVGPKLSKCALTHLDRAPIDVAAASLQHDAYEQALRNVGFEVIRLPDLPEHADGVFVEDTALLIDSDAIITRPGAPSRASEIESTALGLQPHFDLHRIEIGHVDGGDVLRIGSTLYVGLSSRTNYEGFAALKRLAGRLGFETVAARLRNCLHLKSATTLAGHDANGRLVLVYDRSSLDWEQFAGVDVIAVDENERTAANVLRVGEQLIMPAGNPRTAELLRARGFQVVEVDVSELQKAEAGVTCMSLISESAAHT